MNGEQDQGAPGATFGQFGGVSRRRQTQARPVRRPLTASLGAWRKKARECYDMIDGDQWPQEALDQFDFDNRTAIVANKNRAHVAGDFGKSKTARRSVRAA